MTCLPVGNRIASMRFLLMIAVFIGVYVIALPIYAAYGEVRHERRFPYMAVLLATALWGSAAFIFWLFF